MGFWSLLSTIGKVATTVAQYLKIVEGFKPKEQPKPPVTVRELDKHDPEWEEPPSPSVKHTRVRHPNRRRQ